MKIVVEKVARNITVPPLYILLKCAIEFIKSVVESIRFAPSDSQANE